MTPLRILLAVVGSAGDRIALAAYDAGHDLVGRVSSSEALLDAIAEAGADVVVLEARSEILTAAVLRAADGEGVRLACLWADGRGRALLATLGVRENAALDSPWSVLEELIASPGALLERPRAGGGRVVVVWGPTGAPGRTTVAISLAAELAARGRRVLLVDADTHGGAVAPALGLLDESPGFAAACRLAGSGVLTETEIDRIACRRGEGGAEFSILTGLARAERWPELTSERVVAALQACRAWGDDVIVDVGFNLETDEEIVSDYFAPRRNAATLAALESADRVIAVGAADPVGLARFLRSHGGLQEAAPEKPVTVVINAVRASAVGPGPFAQTESALRRFCGIEGARLLPHDLPALDTAVLTSRPVREAAPRSSFSRAVAAFVAAELLPPETRADRRRGRRASRRPLPEERHRGRPIRRSGSGGDHDGGHG